MWEEGEDNDENELNEMLDDSDEQAAEPAAADPTVVESAAECEPNKLFLQIEPAEVIRFNAKHKAKLTLRNQTSGYVAFKVKTSSPKLMNVQPTTGTLQQMDRITIDIVSAERRPGKHERRVVTQAAMAPTGEAMPKDKWSELNDSEIQEFRLQGKIIVQ